MMASTGIRRRVSSWIMGRVYGRGDWGWKATTPTTPTDTLEGPHLGTLIGATNGVSYRYSYRWVSPSLDATYIPMGVLGLLGGGSVGGLWE